MKLSDHVSGGILAALGIAAAFFGSRLPGVPGQDVGPAVFPMVVGGGLILCGVMIALGIGQGFEAPEEEDPTPRHPLYGLRALLPPALLILYVLIAEPVGFLPTAALIIGIAAVALGASLRLAIPLALFAPFGVHAVFAKLLRVPLPDGVLPAPW